MDLYLIRHGETVDNVAGLYAGVRDSALTNHGVEQARRLGDHFAQTGVRISRIYSSPLSRALKTAQRLQKAQQILLGNEDDTSSGEAVEIVQVADLIEQDFGSYEGKPFGARSDSKSTGKDTRSKRLKDRPGFTDVESKESMAARADTFIDQQLLPLFQKEQVGKRQIVAIVSHGMLLAHLWRRLLRRLPRKSVTSQEVIPNTLEHLGGWSNTGYLHLSLSREVTSINVAGKIELAPGDGKEEPATMSSSANILPGPELLGDEPQRLQSWLLNIVSIDNKTHLSGLKRQRGGIGRSAHDEGQRKLESFFKRPRIG